METISIALICTIGGFILSYAAFMRNKDNAIRAETREDAETKANSGAGRQSKCGKEHII